MCKKIFKYIILCIIYLLVLIGCSKQKADFSNILVTKEGRLEELTMKQKLEDFNYLYNVLEDCFPYFKIEEEKVGYNWLSKKIEFEEKIKNTTNNIEFYNELNTILTMVQNAHTNVITPERYSDFLEQYTGQGSEAWEDILSQQGVKEKYIQWEETVVKKKSVLPLKVQYIEGKYVVTADNGDIKKGYIIECIDEKLVDNFIMEIVDKNYLTYDYLRSKAYVNSIYFIVEDSKEYNIKFKDKDGNLITRILKSEEIENVKSLNNEQTFYTDKLQGDTVAYLKVNAMNPNTTASDKLEILEFLKECLDYPYLIIDIRGNGGGADYYWSNNIVEPLIKEEIRYNTALLFKGSYYKSFIESRGVKLNYNLDDIPEKYKNEYDDIDGYVEFNSYCTTKNSIGYQGKIFLLVDSRVYSSAESFAAFCKGTSFAEVIGTATGGDGIGIDPAIMALPNSGLVVRFTMEMGMNSDGTISEKSHTQPDIYCEQNYDDYMNGIDTVLEKVLSLCE